ncbi:VIT and vWA domain-containing protein [Aspergillus undulatus]|uniref:VIT and vWA domain-containing protein n=1 Tax=Aspergillus undulatus TaxID=1810928 RepID=UPI003CCD8DB8
MAAAGIVFEVVEPPSPHLGDHCWEWLQTRDSAYPASFPEALRRRPALLPPVSIGLAISVTQGTAKAVVAQTFRNDTPRTIEKGTYQFPIPHESSVVDFRCKVGTKTLQGKVKPRPAAREEFNQAVKRGYSAGLVEQDSPEIFRTNLGNIPPHTTVEVKLSFIFFLKYTLSDDEVTTTVLTIPTYIAPRFGNPGFQLNETGPRRRTKLSVDIDILASTEIRDVRSDTHRILVEQGGRQGLGQRWADFLTDAPLDIDHTAASVKLDEESACLDRDFIVTISVHSPIDKEMPHATLEAHPDLGASSTMMIEIPPSFMLRNQRPLEDTEVVFLADRSGSMSDKIQGLKQSLEFFLRGLPQTRFNLYCFGSHYTSLWGTSQPYNDDTLGEALRYVSAFDANMGGTSLLPALEGLVRCRAKGSLDVIVLTDGEVWRLHETIDFVRRTHTESGGAVRFFAMGIGNAVSHDLVEGIAKSGGGYTEIIPLASSEGWEARMVAVLKAAMTGHVASISLEVDGVDLQPQGDADSPPTLQMSPSNISTLSPFIRNRIFILAEGSQVNTDSVVKIKTRSISGQEVITQVPVYALKEKDATLHQFAARALISDLATRQSWIQREEKIDPGSLHESEVSQKEGERLGCLHSLVSKWTSFVAVEISEDTGESLEEDWVSISTDTITAGIGNLMRHTSNPRRSCSQSQSFDADFAPDTSAFSLDFSALENPDILENFDFDAFLNTDADTAGFGFQPDAAPAYFTPPVAALTGFPAARRSLRSQSTSDSVNPASSDTARSPQAHPIPGVLFNDPVVEVQCVPMMMNSYSYGDRESSSQASRVEFPPVDNPATFIRQILKYQKADGCFKIPSDGLATCTSPEIQALVSALLAQGVEYTHAVTGVLVIWMEVKMPALKTLWVRMVEKARRWIWMEEHGTVDQKAGGDGRSVLEIADEMVRAD